jgi:hypothetical protein
MAMLENRSFVGLRKVKPFPIGSPGSADVSCFNRSDCDYNPRSLLMITTFILPFGNDLLVIAQVLQIRSGLLQSIQ